MSRSTQKHVPLLFGSERERGKEFGDPHGSLGMKSSLEEQWPFQTGAWEKGVGMRAHSGWLSGRPSKASSGCPVPELLAMMERWVRLGGGGVILLMQPQIGRLLALPFCFEFILLDWCKTAYDSLKAEWRLQIFQASKEGKTSATNKTQYGEKSILTKVSHRLKTFDVYGEKTSLNSKGKSVRSVKYFYVLNFGVNSTQSRDRIQVSLSPRETRLRRGLLIRQITIVMESQGKGLNITPG